MWAHAATSFKIGSRKVFYKCLVQTGKLFRKLRLLRGDKVSARGSVSSLVGEQAPGLAAPSHRNRVSLLANVSRVSARSSAAVLGRRAASSFVHRSRNGGGLGEQNKPRLPIFSLLGLAFATRQTWEKGAETRAGTNEGDAKSKQRKPYFNDYSWDNIERGHLIGQGCDAAVYEARIKPVISMGSEDQMNWNDVNILDESENPSFNNSNAEIAVTMESEKQTEHFNQNDLHSNEDDETVVLSHPPSLISTELSSEPDSLVLEDENDSTKVPTRSIANLEDCHFDSKNQYHLAVKILFNYGFRSDEAAILDGFWKEIVPLQLASVQRKMATWQNGNHVKKKQQLSPHPNIVKIYGWFMSVMPDFPEAEELFPAARPRDLYPDSFGRNMTMVLVMKKYEKTLQNYLLEESPSLEVRARLFAQLLESIAYLVQHKVAHRDLKSNNILLDLSTDGCPLLVLSDFGCCLAEKNLGLIIPYGSHEVNKGGNRILMAPEILEATPGFGHNLNFTKADLWSAGMLAVDIFDAKPFGKICDGKVSLPDYVPDIIHKLVQNLLNRDPAKRLSAAAAANIMHMYLWDIKSVNWTEAWIVDLCVQIVTDWRAKYINTINDEQSVLSSVEHILKTSFLKRFSSKDWKAALDFLAD